MQQFAPNEYNVERAKTLDVIVQQAKANPNITQEIAQRCINMISTCMGPEAVSMLTTGMNLMRNRAAPDESEIRLTYPRANQSAPLQIATFWHRYLTQTLWDLYKSTAGIGDKINATAVHMQKLGIKHPAEKTVS